MATLAMEADTRELVEELRRSVTGEVRFDKMTRMLYSTDASIYQIEPVGVVLPKSADDVIAVLEAAHRYNLPVLPRGGGTSLAGQTVANAIVMDFSRHMRDVLEVNEEEGWVRAQPGIILDELNHKIASSGMFFTPDPSTSSRGNVGGALGNNSCGAHSIIWGKTVDNVESLDVVLSNGDRAHFGQLDGAQLESRMRGESLEGDIYRKLFGIGEAHRNEILARYPKIQRRVSGYNLDEFVGGSDFNMARFVVGSEGTLVTITEAKLKLVEKPKLRATVGHSLQRPDRIHGSDGCDAGDGSGCGGTHRQHDHSAGEEQPGVLADDGLHRGRPGGAAGGGGDRGQRA